MTNQTFVYIPYWIETALNRNNLNISTCFDYAKLRQILSLEDMTGLLALQDIESLTHEKGINNNGTLFNMWNNSVSDTQRAEFTQAVIPMSRGTELKIDILKRLEVQDSMVDQPISSVMSTDQEVEPVFYKLIDVAGPMNAIVIYRGFQKFIIDPDNEYTFVVDLLKIFYVYLKSYQVSALPLFKRYLHLLAYKAHVAQ